MGEVRVRAMRRFLDDFPQRFTEGRYRPDGLPALGFGDTRFDLALCSRFLFTYSEQLSGDFHLNTIEETCRLGRRVFPLLNYDGEPPTPTAAHERVESARVSGRDEAGVLRFSERRQPGSVRRGAPGSAREVEHRQLDLQLFTQVAAAFEAALQI